MIVNFDPNEISIETLIAIHLRTHSCTANHEMRSKYRSAVYTFTNEQAEKAEQTIKYLQTDFDQPIITKVLPFQAFKLNEENYLDYYYKDPTKPFVKTSLIPNSKHW